jgi:hypothetical protein
MAVSIAFGNEGMPAWMYLVSYALLEISVVGDLTEPTD